MHKNPEKHLTAMRQITFFCAGFLLLSFFSCTQKYDKKIITLPAEDAQPFSPQWAVVSVPYAVFESEPGAGDSVANSRMGTVLQVSGKKLHSVRSAKNLWYHFEKGWLPGQAVRIFDNRLKAESAAKKLLQQ